jgi:hypothetical protein
VTVKSSANALSIGLTSIVLCMVSKKPTTVTIVTERLYKRKLTSVRGHGPLC